MPGLRNTIALDFHFNHSLLYWTDVVEDKIYRGKLSESGGMLTHRFLHLKTAELSVKTFTPRSFFLSDSDDDIVLFYSAAVTQTHFCYTGLILSP